MAERHFTHSDYTVGWICPLQVELIAAILMLDERHPRLSQPQADPNVYTLGEISQHNIVIAGLPSADNNSAATVVAHMRSTFPSIRFGLLVGIGGGVPRETDEGLIRLGHVVVSQRTGQHSGAVQYDRGKAEVGIFQPTGNLTAPPPALLNAANNLAADRAMSRVDPLMVNLRRIDTSIEGLRRYLKPRRDWLFKPHYQHPDRTKSCEQGCCEFERISEAHTYQLKVHRGTIASGGLIVKNAELRDSLAEQYDVLCFETEAAGVLNDFPCLVVRGISDYADTHKNNHWQGWAAAAAAAYARGLFPYLPISHVAVMAPSASQSVQPRSSQLAISRDRFDDSDDVQDSDDSDTARQRQYAARSQGTVPVDAQISSDLTRRQITRLSSMRRSGQMALPQEYSLIDSYSGQDRQRAAPNPGLGQARNADDWVRVDSVADITAAAAALQQAMTGTRRGVIPSIIALEASIVTMLGGNIARTIYRSNLQESVRDPKRMNPPISTERWILWIGHLETLMKRASEATGIDPDILFVGFRAMSLRYVEEDEDGFVPA